ncbi:MAG: hypothetical protein JO001_15680 [Alphaproteobacteria bacterium]|nr:hypothetical protein [Alphaproteobacteria bacterium]
MPPDQKREIDFLSELTVAADKLGEKIRDGLITPSGCREGDTGRSRAPISSHTLDYAAITWTGRIEAKPGITIDDFMKAREITIGYFDIGFRRDEIIEHLSAGACDADHESPDSPAQITRTGKPGRPSIWDAIEPECRARFAAGERHPGTAGKENRSAWARELIKWFKSRGGIVLKEGAMQKTLTNHLSLLLDALESDPRTAQNK